MYSQLPEYVPDSTIDEHEQEVPMEQMNIEMDDHIPMDDIDVEDGSEAIQL